jgi:hypothetical protein
VTTLGCEPAAFKAFCQEFDAGGLAFGPIEIFFQVFLGQATDQGWRYQDDNRKQYQHNYKPPFHSNPSFGPFNGRMLAWPAIRSRN